jgi:hypothetical protein
VAGIVAVAGWPGDAGLAVAGPVLLAGTPVTGVAVGRAEDAVGRGIPACWAAHAVVSTVVSAVTAARASVARPRPACPLPGRLLRDSLGTAGPLRACPFSGTSRRGRPFPSRLPRDPPFPAPLFPACAPNAIRVSLRRHAPAWETPAAPGG